MPDLPLDIHLAAPQGVDGPLSLDIQHGGGTEVKLTTPSLTALMGFVAEAQALMALLPSAK